MNATGDLELESIPALEARKVEGANSSALTSEIRAILIEVRGSAETARTAVEAAAESQRQAAVVAQEAQAKAAELSVIATQAVAARTQITDAQAVVATKSDHIQNAQEHADKVRGDLDRALTSAMQQATEAEGLKTRCQSAADTATELLTEIRTSKGTCEAEIAAIEKLHGEAKEATAATAVLADKAADTEERVATYEKRLAELSDQCATQLRTIIGLLPGATSAGLAHAFDSRRQTFVKPRVRWQWIFVGSVMALVILAITGLWHLYSASSTLSYDELVRLWLSRLPVAGALVWLALHASRESALAKRLEEDYGYKSAIAASFEGFHKQMTEIGAAATADSPLSKLCADTLTTIGSPPGRIYDSHELTVSPTAELTNAAKAMTDVVKAAKA
jgi:hypothetical protein